MNPPDQPTPRTDAAWSKTFEDELNQFWSGNAANKMREECATIERELSAAKVECYLQRNRLASIIWSGAIDKHTCGDVQQWVADYNAELTRLRAEVERLKANTHIVAILARVERAEAECLEQARLLGMSGEREADLLGKLGRLESELAAIKHGHGELGKYEQLRLKNAELQAELAAMKGTP